MAARRYLMRQQSSLRRSWFLLRKGAKGGAEKQYRITQRHSRGEEHCSTLIMKHPLGTPFDREQDIQRQGCERKRGGHGTTYVTNAILIKLRIYCSTMKLSSYLLPTFAIVASSALICPSRYCRRGNETPLVGLDDDQARWLSIQEPSRYDWAADGDVPSISNEVMMKRSVDDANQGKKPGRNEYHSSYMKEWRANRLNRINDPNTPPEEEARLQAQVDREHDNQRRVNRYVSLKEAEQVLNPEEMEEFRALRAGQNRFRRANRALKRALKKARKENRELTKAELEDWDGVLADLRAYSKMSREVVRRLDARKAKGGKVQNLSGGTQSQQPQAQTEEEQHVKDSGSPSDIHPSEAVSMPPHKDFWLDLSKSVLDPATKSVQKIGSNVGRTFQQAVAAARRVGSPPLSPFIAPHLPVMAHAVI
ncbi:MAG: hypothetical protein M1816_007011 [Peltula sp. TS41687]|nr:MAG: hypothetical protein M1816_007011 [Peltula sp. TS41687]